MCLIVQVARGTAIFLFLPLLSTGRIGYPLTWKSALFMVWAGLRGAVSSATTGSMNTKMMTSAILSPTGLHLELVLHGFMLSSRNMLHYVTQALSVQQWTKGLCLSSYTFWRYKHNQE